MNTHLLAILLTENNSDDATLIQNYAKNFASIMLAETLNKALDCISKNYFDAILLDLNLPDTECINCVREIKKITTIPIIILTTNDDVSAAEDAMLNGADDYLIKKNITEKVLFRRIRMVMCRRKYMLSRCKNGGLCMNTTESGLEREGHARVDDVIRKLENLNKLMEESYRKEQNRVVLL